MTLQIACVDFIFYCRSQERHVYEIESNRN